MKRARRARPRTSGLVARFRSRASTRSMATSRPCSVAHRDVAFSRWLGGGYSISHGLHGVECIRASCRISNIVEPRTSVAATTSTSYTPTRRAIETAFPNRTSLAITVESPRPSCVRTVTPRIPTSRREPSKPIGMAASTEPIARRVLSMSSGGALAQSGSTTFPAGPRVSSSHVPPLLTTVVGLPGRICSAPPSPRTRTSSSPDLRSQTRASPSTIATKLSPMTDGSTRSLGRSIVICSTIEPSSSTESSEPRSDSITSIWGLDPDPITRESLAPEPSGRDLSATRESDSL